MTLIRRTEDQFKDVKTAAMTATKGIHNRLDENKRANDMRTKAVDEELGAIRLLDEKIGRMVDAADNLKDEFKSVSDRIDESEIIATERATKVDEKLGEIKSLKTTIDRMSDEAAEQARAVDHNKECIRVIMDEMDEIKTDTMTKDTTVETKMEAMKRDATTRNTTVVTKIEAIPTVQTKIIKIGK